MNTDLTPFMKYLPLLIPLLVLQLGLQIWALVDLARREATNGPKWLWAVIIVIGELLGAVVYFIAGRKE
jgi:DMSO reductase anchor subunit